MCSSLFQRLPHSQWIPWSRLVPKYIHDPERKFYEILVPTLDTVRNTWLLELMVHTRQPVLFVGDTGTSKTATIQDFLRKIDQESNVSYTEVAYDVTGTKGALT